MEQNICTRIEFSTGSSTECIAILCRVESLMN